MNQGTALLKLLQIQTMRFLFTLLTILALSLGSATAQTPFTEQILNEIHQGFTTNAVQTFMDRVLPTFMMIGDDGKITDAATFKTWQERGGLAEWPNSEVKIQQSGNLAVATGITRHKPKGAPAAFHQRFTETYVFQNGKWMMATLHYTDIQASKADDEAAIKAVVEKETTAWNARDAATMVSCWANTDYALTAVYHGVMERNNGVYFGPNPNKNLPETVKAIVATMGKPDGSTFKNENYVIRVTGKSAFAYFDQTTTTGDGSQRNAYQIRYLEKISGDWKIVYMGSIIHK